MLCSHECKLKFHAKYAIHNDVIKTAVVLFSLLLDENDTTVDARTVDTKLSNTIYGNGNRRCCAGDECWRRLVGSRAELGKFRYSI